MEFLNSLLLNELKTENFYLAYKFSDVVLNLILISLYHLHRTSSQKNSKSKETRFIYSRLYEIYILVSIQDN